MRGFDKGKNNINETKVYSFFFHFFLDCTVIQTVKKGVEKSLVMPMEEIQKTFESYFVLFLQKSEILLDIQ